MKKLLLLASLCLGSLLASAQLVLSKAVTTQRGSYYFEVANNTITGQNLGCYTLVSYFHEPAESGFYIINLPDYQLASKGVLTISNESTLIGSRAQRINISFADLYRDGRLQRLVIDEQSGIYKPGMASSLPLFERVATDDHLVMLFQGNTLKDASFTVDANRNLPRFLERLPSLGFTNTCGSLVTIRFGALPSLYASIFRLPNEQQTYGFFRDFEIRRNTATVQIAWNTMQEQNLRGFEIEKRVGEEPWTTVAFVASMAPAGAANQTLNYLYGDNAGITGRVQYRLKQVEQDGRSVYSNVQTLDNNLEYDKVRVFPNPSPDGRVNISFGNLNSLRDVEVVDLNGKLVQQWLSINNTTQQISNLHPGNYVVRVYDRQTGTVRTEKLIVRRP